MYHAIKRKIEAIKNERKKQKDEQMAKRQKEKNQQEATLQAEKIIAEQQLPKVITNPIGNAIDIGFNNLSNNTTSKKSSPNKRSSRPRTGN